MALELIALAANADTSGKELRRATARFSGKLKVHAAMENEVLYPSLLAHEDLEVRTVASHMHTTLGPIYDAFEAFEARWADAEAIRAQRTRHQGELVAVLKRLGRRMLQEDEHLYPLADEHLR